MAKSKSSPFLSNILLLLLIIFVSIGGYSAIQYINKDSNNSSSEKSKTNEIQLKQSGQNIQNKETIVLAEINDYVVIEATQNGKKYEGVLYYELDKDFINHLAIEDLSNDRYVSVKITSLAKTPELMRIIITNEDNSFSTLIYFATDIIIAENITIGDLTFYE